MPLVLQISLIFEGLQGGGTPAVLPHSRRAVQIWRKTSALSKRTFFRAAYLSVSAR